MPVTESLRLRVRPHRDAVVVQPIGVLDASTYAQLRDALLERISDEPAAVIVDLSRLRVPSEYSLTVFSSVRARIADWPAVPLMLLAEEPQRHAELAAAPVAQYVPVHRDLRSAMRSVDRPPTHRRSRLSLPAVAASSRLAREFVRDTCLRWRIRPAAADACHVVSELVENVVEHAHGRAELRLELRRGLLTVVVRDPERRSAVLRESPGSRPKPGLAISPGLAIVARLAKAWGCLPTADGGKVVWATLRARPAPA